MPVTAEPPSRRRRWITRIAASAWLLLGIGSCTSILDVERYADVAEEMCTLLDRCYEKSDNITCRDDIRRNLSVTDSNVRAGWLKSITDRSCLDSCSAGRICLDLPPLCAPAGACERRENCCGWLGGHALCEDKTCCATRGSGCAQDEDCCADTGSCDPVTHTCGGTHCSAAKAECAHDLECCTGICKDRRCADTICSDNKFDCGDDRDCCSGFCDPRLSVCADRPVCNEEGTACAIEPDCCEGTHCVRAPGTLAGKCLATTCSLDEVDCSEDKQCCSGRCDPVHFFCSTACSSEDHACAADSDCCEGHCEDQICKGSCSTTSCTKSEDCCSKSCVSGTCLAECKPPTFHSPCTPGGPLQSDEFNKPCIDFICSADPYCCCGEWDGLCVNAALQQAQLCAGLCY